MKNQANLVVPGAIWARTDAKGNGRRSTILLVANQHLKGRLAEEFPPMVTYKDDKGNINTVTAERFTSNRDFWDMDDAVVYQVRTLLAIEPDDEEDDEEDDGLAVIEDGGLAERQSAPTVATHVSTVARPNAPEVVSFEDDSEDTQATPVEASTEVTQQDVEQIPHPSLDAVFISNNDQYPALRPESLEESVVQYEQEPVLTDDGLGLRHKVLVFMSTGLDIDALNAAFDPAMPSYYSSFKMNNIVVNWDSYLGAWPVVATDGVYASMVFTTNPVRTSETTGDAVDVIDVPAEVSRHFMPSENSTAEQIIEHLNTTGITTPAQTDVATALAQGKVEIVNVVQDVVNPARVEQGQQPITQQAQTNEPAPTQQSQVVQVPPPVTLNVVAQGQVAQHRAATTSTLDIVGDTALAVPVTQ